MLIKDNLTVAATALGRHFSAGPDSVSVVLPFDAHLSTDRPDRTFVSFAGRLFPCAFCVNLQQS